MAAVTDKYYVTTITCLMLGIASPFSYPTFFASGDYFQQKYGDQYPNLMFYIVVLLNIFNFLGIIILLIPQSSIFSISCRTYTFLIIMGIAVLIIPSLQLLHDSNIDNIIILIVASFGGLTTGVICTTGCSFAQFLQIDTYMKSIIIGFAIANVLGCVLRFIAKICCSIDEGAWVYFIMSSVINLITVLLFYIDNQTSFVKYYMNKYYKNKDESNGNILTSNINNNNNMICDAMSDSLVPAVETDDDTIKPNDCDGNNGNIQQEQTTEKLNYLKVVNKLKYYILSVFGTQCVTYTMYPSFFQDIPSQYSSLNNNGWMVLLVTFIAGFGDYCGRLWLPFKDKVKDGRKLCVLAAIRIILIPIAVLFYYEVIINDILLYIVICIVMLSNGNLNALIMVKYPTCLTQNEDEIGAAIIQLAYSSGLTLGSVIALVFALW